MHMPAAELAGSEHGYSDADRKALHGYHEEEVPPPTSPREMPGDEEWGTPDRGPLTPVHENSTRHEEPDYPHERKS